jgi:CRP-like cAMP-binding protein
MTSATPIRDLLARHPFFADLSDDDIELIAGCGRNVHFRPGQPVFGEGETADQFFVLRHGRVALSVHGPQHDEITIATVGDGDVLGWSWLFPPYRWHFDARATAETSAVALDGVCLRGKCDDDTALGYRLMQRFARLTQRRLQETRLQLLDLYGREHHGDLPSPS